MKNLWLSLAIFVIGASILFANGGAWQTGVPTTGNASASKSGLHTDVTIENETLKIDLHPEYAAVGFVIACTTLDRRCNRISSFSVRAKIGPAITKARSHANLVVCLVHWGIENSEKITDEQRELARWLIDCGVDLVVGSHPHCVQPLDFYHGCPIAYSLGNLVFDGAPTVASWNRGALLEVDLNKDAKISSVSLVPVVLEEGLPSVEVTESNSFGSR